MNAIILAAGLGTRIRTYVNIPKALIKVDNIPIVESQITALKEIGVNEICIVVGYRSESFSYLTEKFGVKLIYNPNFESYNNIYSLYLCRNHLENTWILNGDVYLRNNCLKEGVFSSSYLSSLKCNTKGEYIIVHDEKNKVIDILPPKDHEQINKDRQHFIISGMSFWTKDASLKIAELLNKYIMISTTISGNNVKNWYWDQVVFHNLSQFDIYIKEVDVSDWSEVDSLTDLLLARSY
ncbi:CTP:phosphocholine cytidylyltransferase-like protein [Arcticibacter tournemirensis]|uniref:NTP transferase domain-containing protein n=1 Tax=Arcticibacter tournemirensis TaxID=699437 RepID=A0A5M9GNJ1_9SPHI|nr:NTP transferase domain-containing protein [Arcticibacter tournemirensis]KAA8474328.1 NTP transferase domain-containing protein [Arcticibacter tournemirensis]TQM51734.1 CTP:phosphocholine cytidylyltransferase-like protein [Arcticibacter tournemirensis]